MDDRFTAAEALALLNLLTFDFGLQGHRREFRHDKDYAVLARKVRRMQEGAPVDAEPGRQVADGEALDTMAHLFSAEEWPGASGLEDLADIVRRTGRAIGDDPSIEWRSH